VSVNEILLLALGILSPLELIDLRLRLCKQIDQSNIDRRVASERFERAVAGEVARGE